MCSYSCWEIDSEVGGKFLNNAYSYMTDGTAVC